MSIQLRDVDLWSEELFKKHKELVIERLDKNYRSWKNLLVSAFLDDPYMRYASYYAVVLGDHCAFLSPVMGVSDCSFWDGKKIGYVCIHPYGVEDALYLIRKFVNDIMDGKWGSDSLLDDLDVIGQLDSVMDAFITRVLIDKKDSDEYEFEDEGVEFLFYSGSWLKDIIFDPDGGYLVEECELLCDYRTPLDSREYFRDDILGFIVIPRSEMIKILEEQGLVIS
jgi:hypothetical protein